MKKNWKVEDVGTISVTRTKPLDEEDQNFKNEDLLKTELTKPNKEEKKEDEIPPVSFIRLFRFSTGAERFLLFIGIIGALVTASIAPLNILLFGELTGALVAYEMGRWGSALTTVASTAVVSTTDALPADALLADVLPADASTAASEEFLEAIQRFAILNTVLGVVMLVVTYVSVWTFNFVANRQILRIRSLYLQSALSQDIGWYDVQQTGDFASRMSEDLTKLEDGIGDKVAQFIHFMGSFVGSLILAFTKGWLLALVCLASLPVTLIAVGIVSVISSRLAKKELEAYGIAGAIAEEVLSSVRTVVAFGGQDSEVKRYTANLVYAKNINVKRGFLSGIGFGFLWFCIYASYALAFWFGVGLVLADRGLPEEEQVYTPTTMVTVFFGVMMASMNLGMTSPFIEAFSIAKGAGAKVFSVIDRVSPINSWSTDGNFPEQMKGNISFRDVHFEYPTRDVKVLQGLNLNINVGEKVALVGSSGCGKSTCIQLIQRFYDPQKGTVMVDGNNVKELNVAWLRKHIGVVGQEPVLFNTTIAENIGFGAEGATEKDIEAAAREANAHDFISKLPMGYKTLVGERGAQLSGGQKQRIAIARALVRKPVILLLDEATSALDTSSESKVQKALDKVSRGRTTVIVAHRLSTIRTADRIVVISHGKVVEQGTHVELLEQKGHYHALVTAQHLNTIDETENGNKEESEDQEDIAFGRLMRTVSRSSSTRSAIHTHEDERTPVIEDDEEEEPPPISMFTILKKNMPEWPYILLGSIGSIVVGFAMPIFGVLFGDIIGVMALEDEEAVREGTNEYSVYFVIAGVAIGIATFLQFYTFGVAGEKLTMRLRGEMFEAMLRQEVAWFDIKSNSSGSLCARLSGDASNVQGATGQRVGLVLQSIATLGLGIGLALFFVWRLGLVVMCFAPFMLLAQYFFMKIARGETLNNQKALEKSTKLAVEAVGNIRTVASLGREKTFHHQYISELLPALELAQRNTHLRAVVFGFARSIMFFAYATAMYYGGHLVVEEGVSIADILKTSQALIMSTMSIANAMGFAPNFQKGLTAASHIFHLLNRKPQMYDAPDDGRDWLAEGDVSYKAIEFFYPTRPSTRVLQGLSLDVLKGQTVALVGHSGCGKSTCIQLLVRFYDPVSGSVNIDERDVSSISMRQLRLQLGIVSQEPVLFDRTIAENIAYGDNGRAVPMSEIIEAAMQANAHTFIQNLPLGYETRMGEKGTQLSGGQKQRVAIARALIRNPRILLLDEATSALDTESEKVVQEALDKAKEGRTCITIAHRLSTIQDADVIFVIEKGQVAEMGTHGELLAKHGLYYQLCSMQNGMT